MDCIDAEYSTDAGEMKGAPAQVTELPRRETSTRPVRLSECKDDQKYAMDSPRRGKAVIFNHEIFDESTGMLPRRGTRVDQENLADVFRDLEFQVTVHVDLTASEIQASIDELSSEDHEDHDCLVICVLTHGVDGGKLYARDASYLQDHLWKPFNACNCPSLAGKPKIFIVQACRGEKVDKGLEIRCDGVLSRSRKVQIDQSYSIPTECDFLIARSSYEEFVSYRNPIYGTIYISNLCEVLKRHGKNLHLLKILTKTARKVMYCEKVQIPCFVSNLTRDVFFLPKNA